MATILPDHANRLNRLGCDGSGIRNDDLGVWAWMAKPVSAIDDVLFERRRNWACDLLNRPCRQAQIDRSSTLIAQPGAFRLIGLTVALHIVERKPHDDSQFIDEG